MLRCDVPCRARSAESGVVLDFQQLSFSLQKENRAAQLRLEQELRLRVPPSNVSLGSGWVASKHSWAALRCTAYMYLLACIHACIICV